MIVDDRIVIVGSANINDRSMRGTRDSEIAVIMEQEEDLRDSIMNGKPYKVSPFAHDFRMKLWRSFLGLQGSDMTIKDPVCSPVYKGIWQQLSKSNTEIYRHVFYPLPDTTFSLEDVRKPLSAQDVHRLGGIRGYLVDYPMELYKYEKMELPVASKERLLPTNVYL